MVTSPTDRPVQHLTDDCSPTEASKPEASGPSTLRSSERWWGVAAKPTANSTFVNLGPGGEPPGGPLL